MDKNEVINLLKDQEKNPREKFSLLVMALNSAPHKNFALVSHYNRSGFSSARLKSLTYDVQKAYAITDAQLKRFEKKKVVKILKSDEMKATDAVEHIQKTDFKDLESFLAKEEGRKTVLSAFEAKEEEAKAEKEEDEEDLKEQDQEEGNEAKENQEQTKLQELNEEVKAIDLEQAKYAQVKALANALADELNLKIPNQQGDTLKAFLEEQKKSLEAKA